MIQSKNKKTNDYDSCFIVHHQTMMKFGEHERNVKVDLGAVERKFYVLECSLNFQVYHHSTTQG